MKTKILYIEDEPFLGKIVKESLEQHGFDVCLEKDGAKVIAAFSSYKPELCILDVMLPHIDGFSIAKHIRNLSPRTPIVFLTAKSQTEDLLQGFQSGGTDYIKKPFSLEELIARVNNQLNLIKGIGVSEMDQNEKINIGQFDFHPGSYELISSKKNIRLSHREAQLLKQFCLHQNQVLERKKLLLAVWGDDSFFNSRTLDVYVRKLREYFAGDNGIEIITLKGTGYHFRVR